MGTEHFDEKADTWDDDPDKARHASQVARSITDRAPVQGGTRLLEYGAGTGLVSQALLEGRRGMRVTLADNSAGMRRVLQGKIDAGELPADARISDLDLESQPVPQERFDLIVSSMVMHHVQQLETVLAAFAELLEPGGYLCIADLDEEGGDFHTHDFEGHHGFDRAWLASAMEAAGFREVTVADSSTIERDGDAFTVFLAVGHTAGTPTP